MSSLGDAVTIIQKLASLLSRVDDLGADFKAFRTAADAKLDEMRTEVGRVSERVARLEAAEESTTARVAGLEAMRDELAQLSERVAVLEAADEAKADKIDAKLARLHAEVDRAVIKIKARMDQLIEAAE
ncbi:MAG: hypothetical protein AAF682_10000 [Planctomycetota bacterium]